MQCRSPRPEDMSLLYYSNGEVQLVFVSRYQIPARCAAVSFGVDLFSKPAAPPPPLRRPDSVPGDGVPVGGD